MYSADHGQSQPQSGHAHLDGACLGDVGLLRRGEINRGGGGATATAVPEALAPATRLTAHSRAVAIAFSETTNGLPGLMQRALWR